MLAILGIVLIVGLCVWLFAPKKDKGVKITCDHCGNMMHLNKAGYDQFQVNGKICPSCKECVNKIISK